jgi:hypothetical protein
MGYFIGDWKEIPAFAEWNSRVETWIEKYQIYEYVPAEDGYDPEGRVKDLDERLVWTCTAEPSDELILPEFSEGDTIRHNVFGWYLAKLPWMPGSDSIESRMIIDCTMCFDSEEEYAPGCEVCDFDGKLFMNLDDLDITI